MKMFRALLVLVLSSSAWTQQAPAPAAAPAAPAAHPSFATVTAVIADSLSSKSCATGKEFRASITSPFVFAGSPVESGAQVLGHIQACNRDQNNKLSVAVILVDSLSLPKGRTVPIAAILQALGSPLPPARVTPNGSDIGYVPTQEFHQDIRAYRAAQQMSDLTEVARRGATNVGILDTTSQGVVGVKHIAFENAVAGTLVAWMFTSDNTDLNVIAGSQMVVRFRVLVAPGQQPQAP
jgi:hypothetical protein